MRATHPDSRDALIEAGKALVAALEALLEATMHVDGHDPAVARMTAARALGEAHALAPAFGVAMPARWPAPDARHPGADPPQVGADLAPPWRQPGAKSPPT